VFAVAAGHYQCRCATVRGNERGHGVDCEHPPSIDHADAIAQSGGLFHVVRRVDDRPAVGTQRLDTLEDRVAGLRVHTHRRLIQQDELRLVNQGRRQVQPPLHTARVGERAIAGAIFELDELQGRPHASREHRTGQAVQAPEELEVLAAGQLVVHGQALGRNADSAANGGICRAAAVPYRHAAFIGRQKSDRQVHCGALAGAVRTKQTEDLAGPYGQRKAVYRCQVAVAFPNVGQREHGAPGL
jgi:hypothetical protein